MNRRYRRNSNNKSEPKSYQAIDPYLHSTHLFPGVIAKCERTKKQQDSVSLFNSNHMLLAAERKNISYFRKGIEDNHRALVAMTSLIQDQILQSIRSPFSYATIKMETAICNVKDAKIYEEKAKPPDWYHSRHISRVLDMAKYTKRGGRDIII